jgi:DNA recombination protein RmuC
MNIPLLLMLALGAAVLALIVTAIFYWQKSQLLHASQQQLSQQAQQLHAGQLQLSEQAAQLAAVGADNKHLQQHSQSLQQELQHSEQALRELREQHARMDSTLQFERVQQQEKLELLQQARAQMGLEFRQLANEILEQKGKSFSESSQQQLQQLLQPLGDKLQQFEKKVEDTYDKEAKQRFSLEKEIKSLLEMNARISADATRLTDALKGENKTQGTWGEVILERVLEKSGLVKGREYDVQVSLKDEDGRRSQPDVVVHLPEQKDIIIDSKVTLTAYQAYFGCDDAEQRAQLLKQHIAAIRSHIKNLSSKQYHNLAGVRSLDYVLLFLPVEAAFTLAVQHDDNLFSEAFEQNIILVGPSTLLATLRTIQNIWRYEYQNKHAIEIARQAGALYDKFAAFAQDLAKIGERIGQTQSAWDDAQNKLVSGRGNLVGRVEKLKTLGARASKSLPEQLLDSGDDESSSDE